MLRKSARVLACVALLGAAPAGAAGNSFTLSTAWGNVAYRSDPRNWTDGETKRLMAGYDLGEVPVFFELARLESDTSTFNYSAYCGCGVIGGIPPDNREFSAWQLVAGYRLWTHRSTGSALSLRGGLYEAESRIYTGWVQRFTSRGFSLGAAGTFMVTPAVGLRVEWEYLSQLEDFQRSSATQTMTGLVVKFGGYPQ